MAPNQLEPYHLSGHLHPDLWPIASLRGGQAILTVLVLIWQAGRKQRRLPERSSLRSCWALTGLGCRQPYIQKQALIREEAVPALQARLRFKATNIWFRRFPPNQAIQELVDYSVSSYGPDLAPDGPGGDHQTHEGESRHGSAAKERLTSDLWKYTTAVSWSALMTNNLHHSQAMYARSRLCAPSLIAVGGAFERFSAPHGNRPP